MVFVSICVGSSCHIKGSSKIVDLVQKKVDENNFSDYVVLTGSFCTGNCNRTGVTVSVNDKPYPGITPETFDEFWNNAVIPLVEAEKGNV
ncbi:MAG: (2Fe-2S) ferredoxin domain-containing protein [Clostridia bacterium]|nr:(2Fe-2S) ferredoxin domain-containing protein [Clostridia bacterium]